MRVASGIRLLVLALAGVCLAAATAEAARIDAKRGRRYQITKKHGPWMIMVASFHKPPPDRRGKGLSPAEAADELVYELRKKGIPAYAFSKKDQKLRVDIKDRIGRRETKISAYRGGVTVLAGNYSGPQHALAQKTLKYIKNYRPKFLGEVEASNDRSKLKRYRNGGLFRSTPGRPGPLSGAHLVPNPLLSVAELNSRRRDPLILKLNSGSKISLLNNPGRYTVVVKTFVGKSMTALNSRRFQEKFESFKVGNSLDEAAQEAWELAMELRNHRNIEAWVYHDRHSSMVTVGSFNSLKDPIEARKIQQIIKNFGSKWVKDPRTGRRVLTAEPYTFPRNPRPGQNVTVRWIFDPKPKVKEIPKFDE